MHISGKYELWCLLKVRGNSMILVLNLINCWPKTRKKMQVNKNGGINFSFAILSNLNYTVLWSHIICYCPELTYLGAMKFSRQSFQFHNFLYTHISFFTREWVWRAFWNFFTEHCSLQSGRCVCKRTWVRLSALPREWIKSVDVLRLSQL